MRGDRSPLSSSRSHLRSDYYCDCDRNEKGRPLLSWGRDTATFTRTDASRLLVGTSVDNTWIEARPSNGPIVFNGSCFAVREQKRLFVRACERARGRGGGLRHWKIDHPTPVTLIAHHSALRRAAHECHREAGKKMHAFNSNYRFPLATLELAKRTLP